MPERACSNDNCEHDTEKGSGISVWVKTCWRKLTRNKSIKNASIPIQLTEKEIELRDGSVSFPIKLPALQKSNAQAIGSLVFFDADGTMKQWDAANFFGKKKLSLIDGAFQLTDDYSSDLFDAAMCSGTCVDIDGIIGYKEIVVTCPGQPDRPAIQLWKIPACCAGEVED